MQALTYDRRLLKPLARRALVSTETLDRFIITDLTARRLMAHATDGLRRRHRWFTRYALDKVAERFYEQVQRPAIDRFIADLEGA